MSDEKAPTVDTCPYPAELPRWVDDAVIACQGNNYKAMRAMFKEPLGMVVQFTDRDSIVALAETAYAQGYRDGFDDAKAQADLFKPEESK